MNNIEDRLRASLKYDVINGDSNEKSVLSRQIEEAIVTIAKMRGALLKIESMNDRVNDVLEAALEANRGLN